MRPNNIVIVFILALGSTKAQDAPLPDKCELDVDLVLMLDLSSTVGGGFDSMKNFVTQIVESLYIGRTRMGIVTFNDQARVVSFLDECQDEQCLLNKINGLPSPSGGTNIDAGLTMTLQQVFSTSRGDRAVEDVLVIITDGQDAGDTIDQQLIDETQRRDMRVIVIAVGDSADDDRIFDLGTRPFYENVFFARSYQELNQVASNMKQLYCVTGVATAIPPEVLPESCEYDIGLLIDTSGSIVENPPYKDNWIQMRQFLRDFVRVIKNTYPKVHVALEHFRNQGNIMFNFQDCDGNTNLECMDQAIRSINTPWGPTRMADAFRIMRTDVFGGPGNRKNVSDLTIFLTDGFPNPLTSDPVPEADTMKRQNNRIVGVGVTANVNEQIMKDIVSSPWQANYQGANNYRALAYLTQNLIARSCSAERTPCTLNADVTLLVDLSGSIGEAPGAYGQLKRFLKGISDFLDFRLSRLAMVSFSDTASLRSDLDDCTDAVCFKRKIDLLPQPRGSTNIGDAFRVALNQVYTPAGGDRANARNVIILVTDGYPNIQTFAGDQAIQQAKTGDFRIMVVGVGEEADSNFLYDIASRPFSENVFFANNFFDLSRLSGYLKDIVCPSAVTTISPSPFTLPDECYYDIALLIDMSGSITQYPPFYDNWVQLRNFLFTFVESIKTRYPNVRLALETFWDSNKIHWLFDQNDYQAMQAEIMQMSPPGGSTVMDSAFRAMRDNVLGHSSNRPGIPDMIIFMTDGFPNPLTADPRPIANQLKYNGVRILGIGITQRVNETLMQEVATPGAYLPVKNYRALASEVESIIGLSCKPYTTTAPPVPCTAEGDLVFVVDGSGSIDSRNFEIVKAFITDLIWSLPVAQDRIRVAIDQFSTNYDNIFYLNKHADKRAMVNDVDLMKFKSGTTNTASVLRHVTDTVLTTRYGDRPDKPNVVVLLTDGSSDQTQRTIAEASRLKAKAHVIVIQVGGWVNEAEIYAMASHPAKENVVKVKRFSALTDIKEKIISLVCNNEEMCKPDQCQNGGTPINMNGICYCTCPNGYVGMDCPKVCDKPADIIFNVDKSGSISTNDFESQIEFLKNFTMSLNFQQHRLGIVSFSDDADEEMKLGECKDKQSCVNAINIWHEGGGTNTYRALDRTRSMFRTPRVVNGQQVPRISITMTDGKSQDQQRTFDAASRLKADGIYSVAVGVGTGYRRHELDGIASPPSSKNVIEVKSYGELNTILADIFDAICDNPCASWVCENGGTPVAEFDRCMCKCPPGFSGPNCRRGCSQRIDLALLVDASGSIRRERFPRIIEFLTEVVGNLTVSPDDVHIGCATWSSSAKLEWNLDKYKNSHDVINAIRRLDFVGQRTNTYNALNIARYSIFGRAGDRNDADDFILMFTDGGSNINVRSTIPEAIALKKAGKRISIVAIGDDMNPFELNAVASDPVDKNILWTPSSAGLARLVDDTYKLVCNDVNECANNPCQNGGSCTDDYMTYYCRCSGSYMGMNCDVACSSNNLDVVMVLDVSGSVHIVYEVILQFAKRLVNNLDIDSGRVRCGMVTFSDRAEVAFDLEEHKTKKGMLIDVTVAQMTGRTNTAQGISRAQIDLLNDRRGDRRGVDNVMVVVTDGQSNVNRPGTVSEADRAKQRGTRIIVVAVGDVDMNEANDIASDPDKDNVVPVKTVNDIDAGVQSVVEKLCI